jgi:hypothetical protein
VLYQLNHASNPAVILLDMTVDLKCKHLWLKLHLMDSYVTFNNLFHLYLVDYTKATKKYPDISKHTFQVARLYLPLFCGYSL